MAKNSRAKTLPGQRPSRSKTVDREHAYEVRMIDGQPAYALKYYQNQSSPNPYARVKVSWGTDMVGHDMYVQVFQGYDLIDNPLAPKPVVVDADPAVAAATQLEFTDYIHVTCCSPSL